MISESELQVEREEVFLLLFFERGADFLLFFWVFFIFAVKNIIGRSVKCEWCGVCELDSSIISIFSS